MGFAPIIDLDRWTCRRIVMMLLSLAVLCERVAVRGPRVRLAVFTLMCRAEAATLTLFDLPADEAGASRAAKLRVGPDDLICIAASLRCLALILAQVLTLDCVDDALVALPAPQALAPAPILLSRGGHAVPFHDTS